MYSPILSKFYTKLFKQLDEIHVRLLLKLNDVKAKDIVANSHGRARRDFTVLSSRRRIGSGAVNWALDVVSYGIITS